MLIPPPLPGSLPGARIATTAGPRNATRGRQPIATVGQPGGCQWYRCQQPLKVKQALLLIHAELAEVERAVTRPALATGDADRARAARRPTPAVRHAQAAEPSACITPP